MRLRLWYNSTFVATTQFSFQIWMPVANRGFEILAIEVKEIGDLEKDSHLIFAAAFELVAAPFCLAHSTNPGGAFFTPSIVAFLALAISRH